MGGTQEGKGSNGLGISAEFRKLVVQFIEWDVRNRNEIVPLC